MGATKKIHVKKNDMVEVLAGKDRGKRGKVLRVLVAKDRAFVEKINIVKCHKRASSQEDEAGIIEKEAALHVSNLQVVCPKCDKGVRTSYKVLENGNKIRICSKCNEQVAY